MSNLVSSNTGITIGGVTCWDEGTEEYFTRVKRSAVRRLRCLWSDRAALMNAIRGGATTVGSAYFYSVTPYPDFPDLYPDDFKITGQGALSQSATGAPAYQWANVQVTYTSLYGVEAQGQVGIDVSTNIISLPSSGPCLESVDDDVVAPGDTPGYPLTVYAITRSVRNVGGLSMNAFINAGKKPLNISSFMGFDPGCVTFDGARASRQSLSKNGTGIESGGPVNPDFNPIGADGSLKGVWDVEYRFMARPALPWDYLGFKLNNGFAVKQVRFLNNYTNPATGTSEWVGRSDLNALFPQSGNLFPTPLSL